MIRNKVTEVLKNRSIAPWIIATLLLIGTTGLHMGQSFTKCNDVVLGQPGDHTAGIIYNSWAATGKNPLGGFSNKTNYPFGENIKQPVSYTAVLPLGAHSALSKITNLVCGWNILVFFSYMSGGLAMFGFIRWLTRNNLIALFASYAVTFTPYHLFASKGQIAGLLNVMFILAIWWFLYIQQKPDIRKGIILGLLVGINFYIDGYFILIGFVMLGAFWISLIIMWLLDRSKRAKLKKHFQSLATASVITLAMLSPLLYINYTNKDKVSSFLEGTRNPVAIDAQTYSAEPLMYLTPPASSPFGGQITKDKFGENKSKNNAMPGLMFIGFGVTSLAIIGTLQLRNGQKKSVKNNQQNLHISIVTLSVISVLAFIVSLKPYFVVGGIKIFTPSALIIQITPSWRVFGRLYMLVAIGVVSLASVGLLHILNKNYGRRYIILALVGIITVFELRSFPASEFSGKFDYRAAPQVYFWLKNQSDIRGVAEYPLNDPPQGKHLAEYFTYQTISEKPLLNSFLPNSEKSGLRKSIAGLNDPQTAPVLRALGIDFVNVHPSDNETSNIKNKYTDEFEHLFSYEGEYSSVDSLRIKPGVVASHALVMPNLQYFQVETTPEQTALYSLGNSTILTIEKLPSAKVDPKTVTFSFDLASDQITRNVAIIQNGKVLWSGEISKNPTKITAKADVDRQIVIQAQDSPEELDRLIMRLTNPRIINN